MLNASAIPHPRYNIYQGFDKKRKIKLKSDTDIGPHARNEISILMMRNQGSAGGRGEKIPGNRQIDRILGFHITIELVTSILKC
jgi:hypothetical protein